MKNRYLATLSLLSVLLVSGAAMAEAPVDDDVRAINVRQLLITNGCAGCDLMGVDLSGAHLIGADLRGAELAGADLSWANLEGADLTKANLTGANLTGAFLTSATLALADLDNANFSQAQLYYVDVTGASMENLNLADATVVGTPISIGGSDSLAEPLEENALPILSPEETLQLPPPSESLPLHDELLDVPLQISPSV